MIGCCSTCKGERVDNCIKHTPECDFYRPREFYLEHPDISDMDSDFAFWYPENMENK